MKEIAILGTIYTVEEDANILKEQNADGICERYGKRILVVPKELMLEDTNDALQQRKRYNEVLRHEAVHAYLAESGLSDYGGDERLVDWIAVQFPKMLRTFQELGCI